MGLARFCKPLQYSQQSSHRFIKHFIDFVVYLFVSFLFFLSELFEISHIRTIYHMFIAVLIIFFLSTLAVDYIDQGRSVGHVDVCVCVVLPCVKLFNPEPNLTETQLIQDFLFSYLPPSLPLCSSGSRKITNQLL